MHFYIFKLQLRQVSRVKVKLTDIYKSSFIEIKEALKAAALAEILSAVAVAVLAALGVLSSNFVVAQIKLLTLY